MDRRLGVLSGLLIAGLINSGCEPKGEFKTAKQIKTEKTAAGHAEHGHEHGAAGPHGGAIVELGDEEYHAEVVVDGKSNTLTVYFFGKDAKTPTPVAAEEITVIGEDDAKHALKAVDPKEGKTSQFALTDEAKVGAIAKAGYLHGTLQADIEGKPYRGDIDAHFDGSTHEETKTAEPATKAE